MKFGVLKESAPETRVAVLPEHIALFKKFNGDVLIEKDAGASSLASDASYEKAGASCVSRDEVFAQADFILCIHLPHENEFSHLKEKILVGNFQPVYQKNIFRQLATSGVTVFSLDMLPRTTRAQSMDVLSSQSNIAGYKAILLAANMYPKYFPMFMTAAGSIPPAKVLILGAGVAGLQAIATARRLGGVVEVFDTRPAVKEEVQSLGAKFIEVEGAADASQAGGYAVEQSAEFLEKQKQRIAQAVQKADVVVTTAQIFGKQAPILITEEMITTMKKGSVIIDIAAATGGNTALTKNNETVSVHGVTIVGDSNLPATMPYDASKMYGKNMANFVALLFNKENKPEINFEDDLVKGACMTYEGNIMNDRLKN